MLYEDTFKTYYSPGNNIWMFNCQTWCKSLSFTVTEITFILRLPSLSLSLVYILHSLWSSQHSSSFSCSTVSFPSLLHFPSPFSELNILSGCICMRPSSDSTHSHTHGRLIKGIDPLNLYELQFVPAAHPVRGVGTHGAVCVCVCCAVVREKKGSCRFWSTPLTSCERRSAR